MKGTTSSFGRLSDDREITLFTLENANGLTIQAINYGANLISVRTPDSRGAVGEITLGFDTLREYEGKHPYFGATIGRYANRIAGGSFVLDGKKYALYCDDGKNHLHGGKEGFDRKVWDADFTYDERKGEVRFVRTSPNGEEGYPGNLKVSVVFCLDESNNLELSYTAESDRPTPINLTNHTYWNLSGPGASILDHALLIQGERYLEIDDQLIPSGALRDVAGTPFDFRNTKTIGQDIEAAGGYDHCFVVSGIPGELRDAATVTDTASGRSMHIRTTQPAIQFYTSNMLDDTPGRDGVIYRKLGALCLETGAYNNAVNIDSFPGTILRPGETYRHRTVHSFSCI